MKEKKLVRFSVKEWQANPKRKVVTQDGKDVRILCVDRLTGEERLPIVALVSYGKTEALCEFDAYGVQNGNDYDNGWILYFGETYDDLLVKELLENGFRPLKDSEGRDFYKTISGENKYDLFVNATQKTASYIRVEQSGAMTNAKIPLNEGTTCAEIQEWAEKLNKALK